MQLCWDCAKATRPDTGKNDTCEWATEGKPVPGWTAEENIREPGTKFESRSYIITDCPKFERDSYGGGMWSREEYERRYSEKTVIIIRRGPEFLVGRIMGTQDLRWTISPWEAWATRDRDDAEAVARAVGGDLWLFNPIVGQLKAM